MSIIPIFLRMAVSYAMFKWIDSEKYAVGLIQDNPLDQNDLRAWMRAFGLWSFVRDVNLEQLASELNACIPHLNQAEEQQLPDEVLKQATYLTDNDIVHDPHARLMSKLAFCLLPNIGVPFDQLVHRGLGRHFGENIRHHDYLNYVSKFNEFFEECDAALQSARLIEDFQDILHPDFMDEFVFRRRATDKYLWILGRLPIGVLNTDIDSNT